MSEPEYCSSCAHYHDTLTRPNCTRGHGDPDGNDEACGEWESTE